MLKFYFAGLFAGLIFLLGSLPVLASSDFASSETTPSTFEPELESKIDPIDPWENWNRGVYQFNSVVDKWTLKPVAKVYRWLMPSWGESAIQRFFANVSTPIHILNHALQGKWSGAVQSTGRFTVNTLMGFAGIFDVATPLGLIAEPEDFGQTLGAWGWQESRYVVLPFLGPSIPT